MFNVNFLKPSAANTYYKKIELYFEWVILRKPKVKFCSQTLLILPGAAYAGDPTLVASGTDRPLAGLTDRPKSIILILYKGNKSAKRLEEDNFVIVNLEKSILMLS